MIGATGNNGNGGAGVNWDVEIMQVDMGSGLTESNVIAAYNYPYTMRISTTRRVAPKARCCGHQRP